MKQIARGFQGLLTCFTMLWHQACIGMAALVLLMTPVQAQEASAAGEVRRIDVAGGKITLIHGPIPDLQLPAMTLVYQAAPNLLQGLKPSDKVKFTARRENNRYVITAISR